MYTLALQRTIQESAKNTGKASEYNPSVTGQPQNQFWTLLTIMLVTIRLLKLKVSKMDGYIQPYTCAHMSTTMLALITAESARMRLTILKEYYPEVSNL